jgi:hypothetical protein
LFGIVEWLPRGKGKEPAVRLHMLTEQFHIVSDYVKAGIAAGPGSGAAFHTSLLLLAVPLLLLSAFIYIFNAHHSRTIPRYLIWDIKDAVIFYLFPVIFLGLAGLITADNIAFNISKKWPLTDATVTASSLSCSKTGGNGETCNVYVSYTCNGYSRDAEVHGSSLNIGEDSAKQLAALYPAGSKIKVHYNPAHPERSRLESAGVVNRGWAVFCFAFSLVFFFLRKVPRPGAEKDQPPATTRKE